MPVSSESRKRHNDQQRKKYRLDSVYRQSRIQNALKYKRELFAISPLFRKLEQLRKTIYTTRQRLDRQLTRIALNERRLLNRVKRLELLKAKWEIEKPKILAALAERRKANDSINRMETNKSQSLGVSLPLLSNNNRRDSI